ncbi:ABC transporter ATP-binding protein [Thermoanaerobacter sp. YS13]|uniref:ABC transporter ATP-binding protein n=1 Tax=Thermoanaerobacter sp. YS13 TaxID=1511746 RepID=UPI0006907B3C|nr:ABC transporter ATP-binding protein [Thermoanaerobacter sp. YS13]
MENIIEIKHLVKTYGKNVLNDINLSLSKNHVLGLIGKNGAGKTTLIKLILGFIKPTHGEVKVFGDNPVNVCGRLGYLPEKPDYHLLFTGREYLTYLAKMLSIKNAKQRVDEVLLLVGMESHSKKRMSKYSKGMLQRIGFAQALLQDPELLILDEPLSGLDPVGRKEIRDIIIDLRSKNKTILLSSHNLDEIEKMCTDIAIINEGKIIKEGSLDKILTVNKRFKLTAHGINSTLLNNLKNTYKIITIDNDNYIFEEQKNGEKEEFLKFILENGVLIDEWVKYKISLEEYFIPLVKADER